ncbi:MULTISPECIES: TIGR02253 family HAD-type hydrolase [Methanosphaera]|uniref:Glyceraldehyde 3-phosphate phosphatase n=2 Tax=Methanosphaera stadtmanae TaxID=2317 RepID=Q2NEW6_METST|nr:MULTISPECIES: TIGR02253 family HAD-type hydrolase [Methanosphaera]ABC57637.1 predicted hydrolase [Methanosphaera stadtmanae DSM 3091]MDO5821864.1 TIGR02253 family HAD-type hydrolase [Methanosphaera sp.]MEE0489179.1 TIGR02253 family HAD-type hydrolase [Methanosphaera stadtmanae]OEC92846.1 haloacid dehalogenase [Methanosphaera sp. A6]RAP02681.1 haloacid dehalogenase [Methanosphaera stadtmanae]
MIQAVFFDMDDTLYDTSGFASIARRAAVKSMVHNGLQCSEEEGYEHLMEIVREKGSNYSKHFNILTNDINGSEDPLIIVNGIITYHNTKFAMLKLQPDSFAILLYLKSKGYKVGLITNGKEFKQWEKLIRLGLYPFFDEIVTSESVGVEKPDAKIYQIAMDRLNVTKGTSIMVGNNFDVDIMGAYNAGMQSMIINSKLTDEQNKKLEQLNYQVRQLDTLTDIMKIL